MAFRLHNTLGTQNERYFVAASPTAHSLACLRIGALVTADAARLATGVGGSPFTGRVSHPLDGEHSFMTSPHRHSPLTSLAWSHHATTPPSAIAAIDSRLRSSVAPGGCITGYVAGSRTRQRAQSKLIFQDDVSSPCIRIEHDNDLATVQLTPDGALLVIQCPLFSTVVCSVTGHKLLEQSVESLATQCLNRDLHNPHSTRSSPPFQGALLHESELAACRT